MRVVSGCIFASVVCLSAAAAAHPGTPIAEAILVNPSDASHVLVTTKFGGFFLTRDGGARWEWLCEQAVGYNSNEAPPTTLTASGSGVVSVSFEGLSIGAQNTCAWNLWAPDESGPHFPDVRLDADQPHQVLALRSNYVEGAYRTEIWRGDPDSNSWSVVGSPLAEDLVGVHASSASGAANRLYVTGAILDAVSGESLPVFETSTNAGTSFERYAPNLSGTLRLIAVGPDASAVAYVRLEGRDGVDQILAFTETGSTHHVVFEGKGILPAGALAPDGSELVVGGPEDGIWRAPTSALATGATDAFTKISELWTHALAWTEEGLYSGGNPVTDGFTVGISRDRGQTFTPFLVLCKVAGPVSCSEENGGACPLAGPLGWESLTGFFPNVGCASPPPPPPPPPTAAEDDAAGCACRTGAKGAPLNASWLAIALAACALTCRRSLPKLLARRNPRRHEARTARGR